MERHSAKRKKRRTRAENAKEASFETVAKGAVTGSAAAVCAMLALAPLAAAVCMLTPDPLSLTLPVGMAILYLSAAIGGCLSSARLRSNIPAALTAAAFCGFTVFLITGICSVLQGMLSPDTSHGFGIGVSLLLRFLAMATSVFSSYIFCKAKPRVKRRHGKR